MFTHGQRTQELQHDMLALDPNLRKPYHSKLVRAQVCRRWKQVLTDPRARGQLWKEVIIDFGHELITAVHTPIAWSDRRPTDEEFRRALPYCCHLLCELALGLATVNPLLPTHIWVASPSGTCKRYKRRSRWTGCQQNKVK